eukprot:scaffold146935_cov31-Cyclotella_meneghiniana.AAC.1
MNDDVEILSAIKAWADFKGMHDDVEILSGTKGCHDNRNVQLNTTRNLTASLKRFGGKCHKCGAYGHKALNCMATDHEMLSAVQHYKPYDKSDVEMLLSIKTRDHDHIEQILNSFQATTKLVNLCQALKTFCSIDN